MIEDEYKKKTSHDNMDARPNIQMIIIFVESAGNVGAASRRASSAWVEELFG